jgi:exodeoxyribonuclease V alpha subunit
MSVSVDVHQVFADYFKDPIIKTLAYLCSEKLSEGHICVSFQELEERLEEKISKAALLEKDWISDDITKTEVFIYHQNNIYFHRYFRYETRILEAIEGFIEHENIKEKHALLKENKAFIQQLFPNSETEIDWQLIACLMAFSHHFSIITGGPGTGKTTSIAKLLSIVFYIIPQSKVALVAPTGKAAARIKESLLQSKSKISVLGQNINQSFENIHSSTIHRLLGYQRNTHYFKHNKSNPLNYDIVIVDESSMMGISLMSKLMDAIHPKAQLILLGDKNQLAAVEAGSIFGDICQSSAVKANTFDTKSLDLINMFSDVSMLPKDISNNGLSSHIIELCKSYRFDDSKGIGQLSQAILNNQITTESEPWNKYEDEQVHFHLNYDSKAFETFYNHYRNYISIEDPQEALRAFNEVRLLSPVHMGQFGVEYFNEAIEKYLIKNGLIKKDGRLYHNQAIIISKNDYQLQLFNGDVGLIRRDQQGQLQAYFEAEDGNLRTINTNFIQDFETVFAMTIHKSQGSEFDHVALVLPNQKDLGILSKELLYTGLTRAKEQLDIFTSKEIFILACQKPVARASGISGRLQITKS